MKRPMLLHLAVQALGLLLSCSIASVAGLIATGAIGGTAAGVAPEFTFGLVEGLVSFRQQPGVWRDQAQL